MKHSLERSPLVGWLWVQSVFTLNRIAANSKSKSDGCHREDTTPYFSSYDWENAVLIINVMAELQALTKAPGTIGRFGRLVNRVLGITLHQAKTYKSERVDFVGDIAHLRVLRWKEASRCSNCKDSHYYRWPEFNKLEIFSDEILNFNTKLSIHVCHKSRQLSQRPSKEKS